MVVDIPFYYKYILAIIHIMGINCIGGPFSILSGK